METGKDQQRINELAFKWMKGIITAEEREEFMQWYNNADDTKPIIIPEDVSADELTHGIKIFSGIGANIETEKPSVRKLPWLRYAAAAVIILGLGVYFFRPETKKEELTVQIDPAPVQHDVAAPASVNAIITLEDGKKIVLDSSGNGLLATQGNIQLKKLSDGEIVYEGVTDKISYNTLLNPRGSKVIQITLADGTSVWLNSESSIRYPTGFSGDERVVEVTGETYFEVAKNPSKPFKVRKNGMEILVTGTHFNVNAYDEEEKLKVTLIEGAVRVTSAASNSITLKPGQQSQIKNDGSLSLEKDVDIESVTAWKDGKFIFDGKTDIGTIMRQIARWYDVDVTYEGQIKSHFSGSISRSVTLSQVLRKMESTRLINFHVEGKKIIVKP